jgi:hypothetical protein
MMILRGGFGRKAKSWPGSFTESLGCLLLAILRFHLPEHLPQHA